MMDFLIGIALLVGCELYKLRPTAGNAQIPQALKWLHGTESRNWSPEMKQRMNKE